MNAQDRRRVEAIIRKANQLMDATPQLNPVVRDVDVVEGILADLQSVMMDRTGTELDRLIELDEN